MRAHYKSTAFAGLIAFPAFIGMVALAPDFVPVVFGTKWMGSVPIMQILAFLGVVQFLTYLNGTMLKALGKPSWQVIIVAVTTVLKVVAFFIAVRFGIIAVAVASLCVGCVAAPAYYWTLHRLIPIRLVAYLNHIKGPLVASLLAGATVFGIRSVLGDGHPLVTLLVGSAVGLVIYVAAIGVVARPLAVEAIDLTRRGIPSLRILDRLAGWRPDETDTIDEGERGSARSVDMTLPTFIVIGVAKAGTTSLYRYFDQHPDVFMYPEKGTNYFGYEDARDWKWADEGERPCSGIFGSTRSMNTRPRSQARLGKMPSVRYHPSTSARRRQPGACMRACPTCR